MLLQKNKKIKIENKILILFISLFSANCHNEQQDEKMRETENLVKLVIEQRQVLYEEGAFDGNGLLYQSTDAFLSLSEICSEEDLLLIHEQISPGTPYVTDISQLGDD